MKRYHMRLALFTLLVVVLVFPGAAFGQGGGDGDDDRGPVDGEAGISSGPSSPDFSDARGTGANGVLPEGAIGREPAPLASSTLVISEVWNGGLDGVEIYNRSNFYQNYNGWTVYVYWGLGSSNWYSKSLPNCWLAPGAVLRVYEGSGSDSCATLTFYFGVGTNIDWGESIYADGAVSLRDGSNNSVDFMRFGGNSFLSGGADWRGFNPMSANGVSQSLQRRANGFDDDYGDNWCVASANMGAVNNITSCPDNYIKITEVDTGAVDGIEVYNGGSRAINLQGTILAFNDTVGANNVNSPNDTFTVTNWDLLPGQRKVFREGSGSNTGTVRYMPAVSIFWGNTYSSGWTKIQLYGTTSGWHDLMWFGNVNLANYTYNPVIDVSGEGLSRTAASSGAVPYSALQGRNWCSVTKTMGSSNASCPSEARLLISELTPGTPDVMEIYNAGGRAVNLRKTRIDFIKATSPYGFDYTYTFGSFTILPFQRIEIREFSGTDDFNTLYTGDNIDWINGRGGAEIHDNGVIVGDFVRLRDSTYNPQATSWAGTLPLLANTNRSHGRSPDWFDTNAASNFCEQNNTFTNVNGSCISTNTPLVASVTCVDPNLNVTITSGDGPFNITASEGQNMPVLGVGTGTTVVLGPDRWRDVTVTETTGDSQSSLLTDRIICRSTEATILQFPPHRSRTTDTTPFFNWTDTTDANLYRIFIFDNKVAADRTVDVRQNNTVSAWTASPPLPTKRLFWRARARVNSAWGFWSVRWTLFIDPIVAQEAIAEGDDGNVVASLPEVQTPAPVIVSEESGAVAPGRDSVAVSAPLPQEIPVDLTGLMAYEAESLTTATQGTWAMRGDANASGSTMVVSSGRPSDALVVNFTGDRFGLQYGTFPGGGNLTLVIDEVPMGIISTDGATGFDLKLFGLSAGPHTARLYSADGMIALDSIYVRGMAETVVQDVEGQETGGSSAGDGSAPSALPSTSTTETEVQQPSALPAPPNAR